MEWWGYLICAVAVYVAGFTSGYGNGKNAGLSQLVGLSQLAKLGQVNPGLLKGVANAAQEHQAQRN
jgi:hypothetical protein